MRRWRSECYQLDPPDADLIAGSGLRPVHACHEWETVVFREARWHEKSASYRGLYEFQAQHDPHLCEDFPGESAEVLGWLGATCWEGEQ